MQLVAETLTAGMEPTSVYDADQNIHDLLYPYEAL